MIAAAVVTLLSFCLRKQLKKKWIVIHRIAALVILVCLIGHMYLGFSSLGDYKSAVAQLDISRVNLAEVKDGSYIGECNVGYIYAKVQVTVKGGQLEDIDLLEHRTEKGRPAEVIVDQMVDEQSNKVDAVSSATNSSKVIMKAVENALKKQAEGKQ